MVIPGGGALPRQAALLGAVPHALDPRRGVAAGGGAGEGGAAGRGVDQDVAEQQAVEAAEHVHHAARGRRQERRRQRGGKGRCVSVCGC